MTDTPRPDGKPGSIPYAVMARRFDQGDELDDYPTPPWAVRALLEHVLDKSGLRKATVLEPACGRGHMVAALAEYFKGVSASDISNYGYGFQTADYLAKDYVFGDADWIITNPPFKHAEAFITRALREAKSGVAIFARTALIEGIKRYNNIYTRTPPVVVAPFTERVPIIKGKVSRTASTATSYSWFVWDRSDLFSRQRTPPMVEWIPPCRTRLERPSDYDD